MKKAPASGEGGEAGAFGGRCTLGGTKSSKPKNAIRHSVPRYIVLRCHVEAGEVPPGTPPCATNWTLVDPSRFGLGGTAKDCPALRAVEHMPSAERRGSCYVARDGCSTDHPAPVQCRGIGRQPTSAARSVIVAAMKVPASFRVLRRAGSSPAGRQAARAG